GRMLCVYSPSALRNSLGIQRISHLCFLKHRKRRRKPNMKALIFATGIALLALANPAYASWAENANMRYPVYTGTDRALARAHQGLDRSTMGRPYRPYRYYPARRYYRTWR